MRRLLTFIGAFALSAFSNTAHSQSGSISYAPGEGPGNGKHIVFVASEWEYRSEESLPMMAKILSERHGFKCTVVFPINPEDGTIDPNVLSNIPGMELLKTSDMMVVFAMDLELPDDQMKHFVDFIEGDKPVFGIRCSLLTFEYLKDTNSKYAGYDHRNTSGGYPQDIFGLVWSGHYGAHAKESTRGVRAGLQEESPLLNGVHDIWGPTDVYRVPGLPDDATVYLHGQVLTGMNPTDPPNLEKSTMPLFWTREIKSESGKVRKVVMSTIGSAEDMESEDLRRLHVNGIYWAMGLESEIPDKADVSYVEDGWSGASFGRDTFIRGLRPEDFALGKSPSRPELTDYYQRVVRYHSRSVDAVPDGSVIFIGDSITQGLAVAAVHPQSVNYGIGGDTTRGVIERLPIYMPALERAKCIVLEIGINDFGKRSVEKAIANYIHILDTLPEDRHVVVSAILPIDEIARTSLAERKEWIADFNSQLEPIVDEREWVTFLDSSMVLDTDDDGRLDASLHTGDGVHLNSAGNLAWASRLREAIESL